jgi:hypothetical protein
MVGTDEIHCVIVGKISTSFDVSWLADLILKGGISKLTTEEIWFGDNLVIWTDNNNIVQIQQNYEFGFSGYYLGGVYNEYYGGSFTKEETFMRIITVEFANREL